jgi:U3 small nucleolar RNA-associated protein 10
LETILPALLSKHKAEKGDGMVEADDEIVLHLSVKPILQVFIDALFHIPKHRRLGLFTILVTVLGEMEFLQPIISLLVSKAIGTGMLAKPGPAPSINKGVLEFASSVSSHFSIESQLKMLYGMLTLVQDTPSIAETEPESPLLFLPRFVSFF